MGSAAPGGQSLGNAQAKISIDTADLLKIQALTQQVGATVARNLGQIDTSAKRTQGAISRLGDAFNGLLPAFGVAAGAGLIAQMGRIVMQSDAMATAFKRQSVAAVSLAGSQENLTALLETYNNVTGNTIDKAQALADVTRLSAIGFADNAQELEQFATAARGISVALGAQQDYIIGQLQQSIANQSKLRLDQIGLGVSEVMQRIKALKAADKSLTEEMAYQNAVLGLATEKYGALAVSAEAQATGAEKAAKAWKELQLQIGESLGPAVSDVMTDLANKLEQVANGLRVITSLVAQVKAGFQGLDLPIPAWLSSVIQRGVQGGLTGGVSTFFDVSNWIAGFAGDTPTAGSEQPRRRRTYAATPAAVPAGPTYTDDQTAAIRQWARDVADIERQSAAARLDATRQYEQQRADAIRDYGRAIVREEEDFQRNRARAIQTFERQIAQVREDAAKREADWLKEHNERVAELRNDGTERLQELEERYNRDRERAAQDHRDRLLDAAARLDAVAVRNEQRNYARQQKDAEENFNEQRDKLRESLREQLADAQRAQDERLAAAREADAERLADMRQAFDRQLAQEDEDRALQMERRAEDHANQLAQLAQAQAERMAKINEQEAREKASLQEAFIEQLNELGLYNDQWLALQKSKEEASLASFARWWDQVNAAFDATVQGPVTEDQAWPTRFVVPSGGPAAAIGPAPAGASRSVNIAEGAIQVYGAPGQDEAQIGRIVRDEMISLLESVN